MNIEIAPLDPQALREQARHVLTLNDRGHYTVPTHGLYPFQWNWDSCLTALGKKAFDEDGAWFEIEHCESGECQRYRIVGPDETDAKAGHISVDSPLARAVLRRRLDDEVEVHLPAGPARYFIILVEYPD